MSQPQEDHADLGVIDEAHLLAARLAAASEVFPIAKADDWDSTARVTADGDVITVVVTDHMGRATRLYRAVLQSVSPGNTEMRTAPVDPGVRAPGGSRSNPTINQISDWRSPS